MSTLAADHWFLTQNITVFYLDVPHEYGGGLVWVRHEALSPSSFAPLPATSFHQALQNTV